MKKQSPRKRQFVSGVRQSSFHSMPLRSRCHEGCCVMELSSHRQRSRRSRTPLVQHHSTKQTVVRRNTTKHLSSGITQEDAPKTSTPRDIQLEQNLRNNQVAIADQNEESLSSLFKKIVSATKTTSVKKTTSQARKSYSDYSSGYSDSEELPKTDYTYAKSETYRSRVTPNRGTTHPNMSRPHIRNRQRSTLAMFSDASSDEEVSHRDSSLIGRLSQYCQHGSESSNVSQTSDKDTDNWENVVTSGRKYNTDLGTSLQGFERTSLKSSYGLDNGYSDEDVEEIHKETFQKRSHSSYRSKISILTGAVARLIGWIWFTTWKTVYLTICYIMLVDTWILQKLSAIRRWKKLLFILFLLLMSLLLLAYLFNQKGNSSYVAAKDLVLSFPSSAAAAWSSLWTRSTSVKKNSMLLMESVYDNIHMGSIFNTISSWWFAFWAAIVGLFRSSSVKNEKQTEQWYTIYQQQQTVMSSDTTHMTEEQIKILVHDIFKQEISGWAAQQEIFSTDKVRQIQEHENTLKTLQLEMRQILQNSQTMFHEMTDMRDKILSQEERKGSAETSMKLSSLKNKLDEVEQKIHSVEDILAAMRNCCQNHSEYMATAEKHVATLLLEIMKGNHRDEKSPFGMFGNWLKTMFVGRDEISSQMGIIADRVTSDLSESLEKRAETVAKAAASAIVAESVKLNKESFSEYVGGSEGAFRQANATKRCASEEEVKKIVKNAIFLYDADKTGLVDYALESSGGSIISTRCSETYSAGTAQITVFGIPIWSNANSPRVVIQPEVYPGQCWAFKGSQGYLVIKLSVVIHPTAFSMEHIPKSLSVTGSINSAPKDFSVWGLQGEDDMEGKLLGTYRYEKDGEPIQYFHVQDPSPGQYQIVELRILSNHGHMDYTCLYRFRVHGRRV